MPSEKDFTSDQLRAVDLIDDWLRGWPGGKQTFALGGLAGCLSGSTEVLYNRGQRVGTRKILMSDLHAKFNGYSGSGRGAAQRWDPDLTTYLTSIWPDGTVSRNEIIGVFQSGKKKVMRIDFDNGQHLVLTEDHPIAVSATDFVAAGELSIGSVVVGKGSLLCKPGNGRRPISERPDRIIINTRFYPYGGVKIVECNGVLYRYKRVAKARLVYEANMNSVSYEEFVDALKNDEVISRSFLYLDQNMDVHHRDENPLNDVIENLEAISHAKHAAHHCGEERFNKDYTREVKVDAISRSYGEEMTYDIQMESPANNFCANGIFVHNSGKSFLISYICDRYPNSQVCAPTGKAAYVQRQNGVDDACTLHSLIYSAQTINGKTVFTKRGNIDCAMVIVDEGAMVGAKENNDLLSFSKPVLYVGDHGQLEPIGDNPNMLAEPDAVLETMHRQAADSPILRLAMAFREGREGQVIAAMQERGWWQDSKKRVTVTTKRHAAGLIKPNTQVICGFNPTRHRMNQEIRRANNHTSELPQPGEPVICLSNQNKFEMFNGQIATILGIIRRGDRTTRAWLGIGAGEMRDVTWLNEQFGKNTFNTFRDKNVLLLDWAYALTAHKCQGSGFDDVLVVEEVSSNWDVRRWRYTAVTRAKSRLVYCL